MLHIDCSEIFRKYGLPKKIIHVGASEAEENDYYLSLGASTVWFEPIPWKAKQIKDKGIEVFEFALGATSKKAKLNIASDPQSSSLLSPKAHLAHYPHIQFYKNIEVQIRTLDSFGLSCDMLVLDTQGYELEVLMGAIKTLEGVKYLYTEFAEEEIFEGNAYLPEILSIAKDFKVEGKWIEDGKGWGEAILIKC